MTRYFVTSKSESPRLSTSERVTAESRHTSFWAERHEPESITFEAPIGEYNIRDEVVVTVAKPEEEVVPDEEVSKTYSITLEPGTPGNVIATAISELLEQRARGDY